MSDEFPFSPRVKKVIDKKKLLNYVKKYYWLKADWLYPNANPKYVFGMPNFVRLVRLIENFGYSWGRAVRVVFPNAKYHRFSGRKWRVH